jgi:dTDP-4-amino-4,6-dideoxygalactose transaminase
MASASCAVVKDLIPVFADVDRDSQNLDPEAVAAAITPRTKAIVAVHLAGWPCDMESLRSIGDEHGLKIIEDCSQAHGATFQGLPVGSWGDIGVFSFCQDKIITTAGEGGMLVTNDDGVWQRAWAYKDHGKNFDLTRGWRGSSRAFRWVHDSFGTNWRLTEVQAAIGRLQLRKLPLWIRRRQENARLLTEGFAETPGMRVTVPPPSISHSYYKYYAFIRPERLRTEWTRDRVVDAINARGVPCFVGSCSEIYLEKAFEGSPSRPRHRLPVARELGETSLQFHVHPTLTAEDMRYVCAEVHAVMTEASK